MTTSSTSTRAIEKNAKREIYKEMISGSDSASATEIFLNTAYKNWDSKFVNRRNLEKYIAGGFKHNDRASQKTLGTLFRSAATFVCATAAPLLIIAAFGAVTAGITGVYDALTDDRAQSIGDAIASVASEVKDGFEFWAIPGTIFNFVVLPTTLFFGNEAAKAIVTAQLDAETAYRTIIGPALAKIGVEANTPAKVFLKQDAFYEAAKPLVARELNGASTDALADMAFQISLRKDEDYNNFLNTNPSARERNAVTDERQASFDAKVTRIARQRTQAGHSATHTEYAPG